MERLSIQEIVDHCDRQLKREPVGSIFHREHEAVKAYLLELQHFRDSGLKPDDLCKIGHLFADDTCIGMDFVAACIDAAKFGVVAENLRELAEASADGRLVVLPCKLNSVVYGAETSPVIPLHIIEPAVYLESAEGGDFETLDNFGKTVFLTREEAEAALRKEDAE